MTWDSVSSTKWNRDSLSLLFFIWVDEGFTRTRDCVTEYWLSISYLLVGRVTVVDVN